MSALIIAFIATQNEFASKIPRRLQRRNFLCTRNPIFSNTRPAMFNVRRVGGLELMKFGRSVRESGGRRQSETERNAAELEQNRRRGRHEQRKTGRRDCVNKLAR